jgi:hypothetical protein
VQPEPPQPFRQLRVLGHHHAAVAEGSQVLAGEKRQCADGPELPGHAPRTVHPPPRADCLGRVLDDRDPPRFRQRQDPLDGGHLAEEVHGDDGAGTRRDGRFDSGR